MADARYRFELLGPHHHRADFSCGVELLDRYLRERAGQDVRSHMAAVHVMHDTEADRIAGFYTLSCAGINPPDLPDAIVRKLPRYPALPAILLGRLALDARYQGQGLGKLLLIHALQLAHEFSEHIGAMAVIVDAKDEDTSRFYQQYDFEPFTSIEGRLYLLMARIARTYGSVSP
ncbi:MAG: GNAT family N-acetyltransferase [Thermomicrobiales bacterium]